MLYLKNTEELLGSYGIKSKGARNHHFEEIPKVVKADIFIFFVSFQGISLIWCYRLFVFFCFTNRILYYISMSWHLEQHRESGKGVVVRDTNPSLNTVENLNIILQLALFTGGLASAKSSSFSGYCGPIAVFIEKSTCKCTYTIQSYVVQQSTTVYTLLVSQNHQFAYLNTMIYYMINR